MSEINFRGKGLNQKIFSKKTVRATVGKRSSAFKAIMGNKEVAHVIDKYREKKVFYDALRKRGQESDKRGITKKVLKKVLGDIEHSGEFSHKEMHKLGEELIGGAANKRIIRDHSSGHSNDRFDQHAKITLEQSPKVDRQKTFDEIIKKDVTKRFDSSCMVGKRGPRENTHSSDNDLSPRPIFSLSDKALRKAQERNVIADREGGVSANDSGNHGQVPKYLRNFNTNADIEKAQSLIAKIQDDNGSENSDEDEYRLAA